MSRIETSGAADGVSIYEARSRLGWQAAGSIAGGILVLLFLALRFILLVGEPNRRGHEFIPGLLGGASVAGLALLARGLFLLRSVVRVALDPGGIHLERLISRQSVKWSDVDRIDRDKRTHWLGSQTFHVVTLIGRDGKPLAMIPDTIDRFEQLTDEIAHCSAFARGQPTYDAAANEQRRTSRDARKLRWTSIFLLLFALGMGAGFVAGIYEEVHVRRYATEGIVTDARITRRYMVRVTPRLEYSFVDGQGVRHTREVMMEQDAWDALQGQPTVSVQYLRSDPQWNRPLAGEQNEASFGGKFLFVTGGGLLFFGLLAIVTLSGIDLKSEDGQFIVVRRGKVIRTFGQARV